MLDEATTALALRRLRSLSGISERAAARALGTNKRTLRSWESQTSTPSSDEVNLAVALYAADIRILVDRTPLLSADHPGVLVVGDEQILVAEHFASGLEPHDANRGLLSAYLGALTRQRGTAPASQVELRASDLAALSIELDMADEHLDDLFSDLFDLTPAGAQTVTRAMLAGALLALAGTGMLGAAWVTTAAPSSARSEQAQAAPSPGNHELSGRGTSSTSTFTTAPNTGEGSLGASSTRAANPGEAEISAESNVFSVSPRDSSRFETTERFRRVSPQRQELSAGSRELPTDT